MKLNRVLALTSPMMRGDDVKHAQRMLNSTAPGTRYGNYRPGGVDGYFGQNTAAACKRAKYWLGYPKYRIKGTYGNTLDAFLHGKDLPRTYRLRRAARIRKANNPAPIRERAFKKAVSQIGVKESPAGSNNVKYADWYSIIGPWCAMFITWCYVEVGAKESFRRGVRYAYVPYMVEDARGRDMHMIKISKDEVERGDIVTFDWNGGGMTGPAYASDHAGLFDQWINKDAGTFRTVEGNSSDAVVRRERTMKDVSCFIRAEV